MKEITWFYSPKVYVKNNLKEFTDKEFIDRFIEHLKNYVILITIDGQIVYDQTKK